VFGVLHGLPVLLPAYLVYGVALALLRVLSGGLAAPMIAHGLNNGVLLYLIEN
jgi:membrane protease YdiL (CAAX protease family)